jgi:ureidoacrylate peracid hydrolase
MTRTPRDILPADMVRAATHRRGRLELFDTLEPRNTALVVIDMQNAWLAPGGPFETPPARSLIPRLNQLATTLRRKQGSVIWIQHTAGKEGEEGYWPLYFDNFIAQERRAAAIQALTPGSPMHALHPDLSVEMGDLILPKYRFSAFLRTPHSLEEMLTARGIDTLIVTGTATNVCVESTARDAMMLDFRVFMPHDGTAALDHDAHLAGVRNVMQSFADVRPVESLLWLIENGDEGGGDVINNPREVRYEPDA